MRSRTFSIVTLGCRANQADSAAVAAYLEAAGLVRVGHKEAADLVLVNTCTVTAVADRQSRQAFYRALRRSPEGLVVAAGCWARLGGQGVELPERLVLSKAAEPEDIARDILAKLGIEAPAPGRPGLAAAARPPVKIQNGCDEQCAYCVVRVARGASHSLPEDRVVDMLSEAADQGRAEVVLTGINLGAWGRDIGSSLSELLRRLARREDLPRIRLSSIEPMELTRELLEVMAEHPDRICPFLHVPLQTGSARLLEVMKRPYGPTEYRSVLQRAADWIPDICLGADVIAGLPTETEEDFEETRRFLETLPLAYLHVFPYSERPGTQAACMKPLPDIHVRRARAALLREWSARRRRQFHETQVGKTRRAVLEKPRSRMPQAVTDNYVTVLLDDDLGLPQGSDLRVTVDRVGTEGVFGRIQPAT